MKARRSMRRIVSLAIKPLERRDVLGVEAESPFPAIGEPVPQGRADRAKGDFLPGNPLFVEEGHLEGLFTGPEAQVQQPAEVEEMHLVRPRHREHAERRAELDASAGFLERLAQRRLARGLVVLHEAGGQGPVAVAGLDGADRKSTRLNSSHGYISYAVFCLKKKKIDWNWCQVRRCLATGQML